MAILVKWDGVGKGGCGSNLFGEGYYSCTEILYFKLNVKFGFHFLIDQFNYRGLRKQQID